MTYCHVTAQINQFLADEDRAIAESECRQNQIDLLISLFSDLTNSQIDDALMKDYDFDLKDWLEDHWNDDGVYEYFVLQNNQYYQVVMQSVFESALETEEY